MRDRAWRAAGCGLLLIGYGLTAFWHPVGLGAVLALIGFALVMLGLLLVVQGRRVGVALRVERSRHRELPLAIHNRRIQARQRRKNML